MGLTSGPGRPVRFLVVILLMGLAACQAQSDVPVSDSASHPTLATGTLGFGRPARPGEIERWDIDVRPDGTGLPEGSGGFQHGSLTYSLKCAGCHGGGGEGTANAPPLVPSAASSRPIAVFWPYATTLFDYIRRSMPSPAPESLTPDEAYGLVVWVLAMNDLVPKTFVADRQTLPQVVMPALARFYPDPRLLEYTTEQEAKDR